MTAKNSRFKPEAPQPTGPERARVATTARPSTPMSDEAWAQVEAGFGTFDFVCEPKTLRRQET